MLPTDAPKAWSTTGRFNHRFFHRSISISLKVSVNEINHCKFANWHHISLIYTMLWALIHLCIKQQFYVSNVCFSHVTFLRWCDSSLATQSVNPCHFTWDVIKWKHFPRYCPFVRGIHRSPVNSPHKGPWRGALMFSLICVLNKRLSKQSWGWWFETPTRSLWRHCNVRCILSFSKGYQAGRE